MQNWELEIQENKKTWRMTLLVVSTTFFYRNLINWTLKCTLEIRVWFSEQHSFNLRIWIFGEEYKYLCNNFLTIDTTPQDLIQQKPVYIFNFTYFNLFMIDCIYFYFAGLRSVLQTEKSEGRVLGESGC